MKSVAIPYSERQKSEWRATRKNSLLMTPAITAAERQAKIDAINDEIAVFLTGWNKRFDAIDALEIAQADKDEKLRPLAAEHDEFMAVANHRLALTGAILTLDERDSEIALLDADDAAMREKYGVQAHSNDDEIQRAHDESRHQEKKKTQYQRDRRVEYPPIAEQLDAIWKALTPMRDALPAQAQEMLDAILAVKEKHPKPIL